MKRIQAKKVTAVKVQKKVTKKPIAVKLEAMREGAEKEIDLPEGGIKQITVMPSEPYIPPSNTSLQSEMPTHFDELLKGETPIFDDIPLNEPLKAEPLMLSKEDYHKIFITGFKIGHGLTGLQSLKVADNDESARDCAYAMYDCILDVPALHFLLKPQNKWFERAVTIGAFTVPMALSVKDELAMRRLAQVRKPEPSTNENVMEFNSRPAEGEPSPEQAAALGA